VKVLLDEQLSPLIARVLRERGLDVAAAAERPDLVEASDREILDAATREQRAVVTNDIKDLRPIAAERIADGRGHAGVILVPAKRSRRRATTGAFADAIEALMRAHPDGIAGAEHWIPPF
jgi:2-phospho-L-lactate guanylyltransferase (CobY/MobA/RfbA family)